MRTGEHQFRRCKVKPINPQIVDVDLDSPMSEEEIKRLNFIEKILKDNWVDEEQFDLEQGKRLYEIKQMECWKYSEIFRIKSGKNKGKFEKNPKFEKYYKNYCGSNFGTSEWTDLRRQLKKYESYLRQKQYHKEQVEKFKKIEEKINEQ